jgi:hypothetical protein
MLLVLAMLDLTQYTRTILLSSGARHPLGAVSACLGLLDSYLRDAESRQCVADLRLLCLGEPLPEDRRAELVRHSLLEADLTVSPVMKDVVLSAIRGEDQGIFLVSPFTSSWDRTMHNLSEAQGRIRSELPRREAETLLGQDIIRTLFEQSVTHRSRGNGPDPEGQWQKRSKREDPPLR